MSRTPLLSWLVLSGVLVVGPVSAEPLPTAPALAAEQATPSFAAGPAQPSTAALFEVVPPDGPVGPAQPSTAALFEVVPPDGPVGPAAPVAAAFATVEAPLPLTAGPAAAFEAVEQVEPARLDAGAAFQTAERSARPGRGAAAELEGSVDAPPLAQLPPPELPPECAVEGACRSLTFYRAVSCRPVRPWTVRAKTNCDSEERLEVTLGAAGVVASRPLPAALPRNPYPAELVGQWRHCPFATTADPPPAAGDALVAYEDAELGGCWLLRAGEQTRELGRRANLGMLDGLHPYLVDTVRRMLARAAAEGYEFKVISGNRRPGRHTVWVKRKVKVGGHWRTKRTRRTVWRGAGWHGYGLAFDVNLMHRNDLRSASAAFSEIGSAEREAWMRLGEIGEEYGLIWLGHYKASEIFHFEWHPGWPGMPKGAVGRQLERVSAKGGLKAVWELMRPASARAPGIFRQLRD